MPPRPLVFGPASPGADATTDWRSFQAKAKGARALVVHVAGHRDAVRAWLTSGVPHPPLVIVETDPGRHAEWIRLGADEVTEREEPDAWGRALTHAAARASHRASAHQFRQLVENALDLVSIIDGFGRYVYLSPSARDLLGIDPAERIGTNAFEGIHPDDRVPAMESFLEAIGTEGSTRRMTYRVMAGDGSHRLFEGVGRAITGEDGEPYALVTARDVTDRVRTETALRQSESRYRSLLEALPDVISRIRRDGRVLDFHVPPVFATEFPADALLGKVLQDEIPAEIGRQFVEAVAKVDASVGPVTYRYAVDTADGRHYREARIVPHGPEEVLSILRDVTPEVEAELGLRASKADLEASQAELRALAAHLQDVREEERAHLSREVHDTLGQQLTAIRYAVGWFGRRLAEDPDAQRRLEDARALIDETIAQVRRIAADLRPGVLDDFGLATATEWYAERFAERTGLEIAVTESGDASGVPGEVETAAFRIVQEALTNVARHANASRVEISVQASPEALHVRVADDGVGLDPDALVGRRSLGVVGMRERARAQGGALTIEGTPGRGAAVSVSFPLPLLPSA